MQTRTILPDIERLSIVSATIMLAFALTQLVSFPIQSVSFIVLGILIEFVVDFSTMVIVFTVFLSASGMDWIIHSHPEKDRYQNRWAYIRHWIVPILTSFVIGVTLNTFAGGLAWWAVYILGSLLVFAVFIAEYNVLIAEDYRNPLATVGLTSLSFVLYLLLAIAVFSANIRLYLRAPLLGAGALMVIARSLFLRLGKWHIIWAVVSSLIITQIVVGLHYLPLSSIQLGLLLVGTTYGLTSIVSGVKESRDSWALWGEPVSMIAIILLALIVLG